MISPIHWYAPSTRTSFDENIASSSAANMADPSDSRASSSSQSFGPTNPFISLPFDIQNHIFSYLSPSDLSSVSLTSKEAHNIVSKRRIRELNANKGKISSLNLSPNAVELLLRNHGKELHSLSLSNLPRDKALRLIKYCPNLEYLKIKNPIRVDLNTRTLIPLEKLKTLKLKGEMVDLEDFYCPNLEYLKMEKKAITENAKTITLQLKNLKTLKLTAPLYTEDVMAITKMEGLENLNLTSNNSIGSEEAAAIAEMIGLKSLDLSGNSIGDKDAMAIAEMRGLKNLNLKHNCIGDEGAMAIAEKMIELETLNLACNCIGDEGAMAIAEKMIGLKNLNLAYNHISNECKRAIDEKTPKLESLFL